MGPTEQALVRGRDGPPGVDVGSSPLRRPGLAPRPAVRALLESPQRRGQPVAPRTSDAPGTGVGAGTMTDRAGEEAREPEGPPRWLTATVLALGIAGAIGIPAVEAPVAGWRGVPAWAWVLKLAVDGFCTGMGLGFIVGFVGDSVVTLVVGAARRLRAGRGRE